MQRVAVRADGFAWNGKTYRALQRFPGSPANSPALAGFVGAFYLCKLSIGFQRPVSVPLSLPRKNPVSRDKLTRDVRDQTDLRKKRPRHWKNKIWFSG
jgi:hypothetical protein